MSRNILSAVGCCIDADKKYTMRTCSSKGGSQHIPIPGYAHDCYENDEFAPEYCAISCYCRNRDNCNDFAAPPLGRDGKQKVGRSSCLASSPVVILLGVLMTILHI